MARIVERPPSVPGVPEATRADALRLLWWSQLGYRHGAAHGRSAGRVFSRVMTVAWWLAAPAGVAVQAYLLSRKASRYYLSPERDAVIAVVATTEGWQVGDHIAAQPGTGRGKALRDLVNPQLTAHADAARIGIYMTAANDRLARQYADELPGLVDVGRGFPRGRKMRREPMPSGEESAP